MRHLISFFLLLFLPCFSQAQYGYAPEIGIGLSNIQFTPSPQFTSFSSGSVISGRFGGSLDIGLNRKIYIQPGIFFSFKGGSRSFSYYFKDSFNETNDQTLHLSYVDISFSALYKTAVQGLGRAFFGIGITASNILGGSNQLHSKGDYNGTPYDVNNNTAVVSGNPLKGFDIGVTFFGGYELPTGLFFKLHYTSGTYDLGLRGENDKNRMGGIGVGYYFGKGRNVNKDEEHLIDNSTE